MKAGLTISFVGHAAVLLWGLISFAPKAFDAPPAESLPVDIISATEFSQLVAGNRNAPRAEVPQPLVEKVGDTKAADNPTVKVSDRPEVLASIPAPVPPPAPERRPPEPSAVAPTPPQPRSETKKEPNRKDPDPIAEALKKDETKRQDPKKDAKVPTPPKKVDPPKVQPKLDPSRIMALLDKRDPQRHAATGEVVNRTPALGVAATTNAPQLTQSDIEALRAQIKRCWIVPVGATDARDLRVEFNLRLKQDGSLAADPVLLNNAASPYFQVFAESAMRALRQCQPYALPAAKYETWKDIDVGFRVGDMFGG